VSALEFWRSFRSHVRESSMTGYGGEWTASMYAALHRVQDELGLWCNCLDQHRPSHGASGELLKIDMMWFRRDGEQWDPPVVAIEHENAWDANAALIDFWRVSQVCALLRVCIVYTRRAVDVDPLRERLLGVAHEHGWRRPPMAEDLLVIGHGEMEAGDFRAWRCHTREPDELTRHE
jgi:hypothetical protein